MNYKGIFKRLFILGARFGLMQIKVGLTSVIKNYQVSVNKKMKTPIRYASNAFVTSVEGGVWLTVHEIN